MAISIPSRLAANCRKHAERTAWRGRLPDTLRNLEGEWSVTLGAPFDGEDVRCAWVAPARLADGSSAVLKVGMPHMEADHELEGLRFWNGDPTAPVLRGRSNWRDAPGALRTGTPLRALAEQIQDVVIAGLLRRLWPSPPASHPFRPLSALMEFFSEETLAHVEQ